MDFASPSQAGRITALLLCLCLSSRALPQEPRADADRKATVRRLYAEKRWEEIVQFAPLSSDPAELDLYRGLALAQLQRWAEARTAFETGRKKEPRDKRFPLELAGVAYRQQKLSEAKTNLKRALRLDRGDVYAQDFLATIYLLEGNLEAALQHWNPIGKPQITNLKFDPRPRVRAVLLDRAFAFSPAEVLHLNDLRTTEARIENMGIFPRYRFELVPEQEQSFAVMFRAAERNGWGDGTLDGLLSLLRGLPYQAVQPEFYNLNHSSLNVTSLQRWDSQKRRLFASLSIPLGQDPKWRPQFYLDGRNENWDLSGTFQGATSPKTDVKLQKAEAGAEIRSVVSGRWTWKSGMSLAYRSFGNLGGITPQAAPFFTGSFSLKYYAGFNYKLLRVPERRFTVDSIVSGQFGKAFARPLGPFGGIEGSLDVHWFPLPRGDDYEMRSRLRAGAIMGRVPLDELFALGIERDNNLWLRAHIGTRHGKKGNAPMGRQFILWNWETDKVVYQNAFLTLKLGPFLDAGKVADSSGDFRSGGWLWDPGVQCKVRVLESLTIVFSYGRNLRSSRNAFYTTVAR